MRWAEGDRVALTPTGLAADWTTATVEAVEERGVHVRLDREVRGVWTAFATHRELDRVAEVGDVAPAALAQIVAVESMMLGRGPSPSGRCPCCSLDVRLTPGGYVESHGCFVVEGERPALFSWAALAAGQHGRSVVNCRGTGRRPRRRS